ncbi:B3 domain-containing transcription factor VRN1-like isoform X2 [Henckelia pumila]|uniref:B3 domain-containing transcription factor VRN1-like isoform X2 n=1 Tax=Henckelia pumila TaxID=405737 RepID=UPI003C6E362A
MLEICWQRLPIEFIRRHGHNLAGRVSVKVPSGLVWKVELIRSDGETWLHRGWQQFEEYYSINVGHFLFFEYIGNSQFEVHIFDTTATEINYIHYDHSIHRGLNQAADEAEGIESDSDDSVVFLKEILTGKDGDDAHDDKTVEEVIIRPSRMQHTNSTVRSKCLDIKRDVNDRSEAYTRALAFMSENPTTKPFSIVVMQPSYVDSKYRALNIPKPFAREVLSRKVNSLILSVSEGKTWLIRCVYSNYLRGLLTTGWPKFVDDNELKVGDVCVFEVAEKAINMTWNAVIFRS